jgi:hypothetical protein
MWNEKLMRVMWPAFLSACVLELLVFGAVDPAQLHWFDHPFGWSRQGVYTVAFFVFWGVSAVGNLFDESSPANWLSTTAA